ncbi:MAG: tRNA 4-thiouridine(8) synthase ThiI [Patescibacteria group bacterium]
MPKHSSQKPRALVVFSGGLDSILAVKILQNAGCEVAALTFESPFFGSGKAKISAKNLCIQIFIQDFSQKIWSLVKNPPSGFGKNLNPCIDCHAAMFRLAADFAQKNNFQILASGEVLGQRPFSQTRSSLNRVAKLSGAEILRPLSAQLLPPTSFEKSGFVDREKLLNLSGRSRKPQLALAKKFGLKNFPAPAGGCLLTEPTFAQKLKILLDRDPTFSVDDTKVMKIGRLSLLGQKSFAVLGRDFADNEKLCALENVKIYLVKMRDFAGPTAFLRVKKPDSFTKIFPLLAAKIRSYGRESKNFSGKIAFQISGKVSQVREN